MSAGDGSVNDASLESWIKGMPKVKEDQRSTVSLASRYDAVFFVWDPGVAIACACAAPVQEGETSVHHQ